LQNIWCFINLNQLYVEYNCFGCFEYFWISWDYDRCLKIWIWYVDFEWIEWLYVVVGKFCRLWLHCKWLRFLVSYKNWVMMHCVLNGTNFGICVLVHWDTVSVLLGYGSLFNWDASPCSIGIRVPVLLGYESLFFGIRVPVRLAYAYIYHGVFVCVVFMIYIFLVAW